MPFAVVFACCLLPLPEPAARVTGVVTVNGKPPAAAMVVAECRERGILATAAIGADARYELLTAPGRGLPAGTYKVAIIGRPGRSDDIAESMKPRFLKPGEKLPTATAKDGIPSKYQSTDASDLAMQVTLPPIEFNIVLPAGFAAGEKP